MPVGFDPKSGSVSRILKSWNIGADSVVFIDDSPMELAEVERAFPEMECMVFPGKDGPAFLNFINMLRDRFGKEEVSMEDGFVKVVSPDLVIFVGDAMTGNDAAEQARKFAEIGLDAVMLTKADTDPKGGSCISISYVTQKPILFLGTGQAIPTIRRNHTSIFLKYNDEYALTYFVTKYKYKINESKDVNVSRYKVKLKDIDKYQSVHYTGTRNKALIFKELSLYPAFT